MAFIERCVSKALMMKYKSLALMKSQEDASSCDKKTRGLSFCFCKDNKNTRPCERFMYRFRLKRFLENFK